MKALVEVKSCEDSVTEQKAALEERFSQRLASIAKKLFTPTLWFELAEGDKFLQIRKKSGRHLQKHNLIFPEIEDSKFKVHINIDSKSYDAKIEDIVEIVTSEFVKHSFTAGRPTKDIIFTQMKYLSMNLSDVQADFSLFPHVIKFYDLIINREFDKAKSLKDQYNLLQKSPFKNAIKATINNIDSIEGREIIVQDAPRLQAEAKQYKQEAERMMHGTQITMYLADDIMDVPAKQQAMKKIIYSITSRFAEKAIATGSTPESDVVFARNCPVSLRNTGDQYVAGTSDSDDLTTLKEEAEATPLYKAVADVKIEKPINKIKYLLAHCQKFLLIKKGKNDKDYASQKNVVRVLRESLESKDDLPLSRLFKFNELYQSMKAVLEEGQQPVRSFFFKPGKTELQKNMQKIETILSSTLSMAASDTTKTVSSNRRWFT